MEESAFGVIHKAFNKNEKRLKSAGEQADSRGYRDAKARSAFYRHNAGSYGKTVGTYKRINTDDFPVLDEMKQKGVRESISLARKNKAKSKETAAEYRKQNPSKGLKRGLYWTDMHTPAKLKTMRMVKR